MSVFPTNMNSHLMNLGTPFNGMTDFNGIINMGIAEVTRPGIYNIKEFKSEDGTMQYQLEFRRESFKVPERIYGNTSWFIQHYWKGFVDRNYKAGILLTGKAGAGKTDIGKILANKCIDAGMRAVMVTNIKYTPKLIQFLDELDNVVMFYDEFSKVFRYGEQSKMLTLLSNTLDFRRISIITENDLSSISEHIRNRPGRIFYSKHLPKIDITVITDYLSEQTLAKDFKEDIMKLYKVSLGFVYDHLQAIVEQCKRSPELEFKQIIDLLNLDQFSKEDVYSLSKLVKLDSDGKETEELDIKLYEVKPGVIKIDELERGFQYSVIEKPKDGEKDDKPNSRFGNNDSDKETILVGKGNMDELYDKEIVFKTGKYKVVFKETDPDTINVEMQENKWGNSYL